MLLVQVVKGCRIDHNYHWFLVGKGNMLNNNMGETPYYPFNSSLNNFSLFSSNV